MEDTIWPITTGEREEHFSVWVCHLNIYRERTATVPTWDTYFNQKRSQETIPIYRYYQW